MSKGLKSLASFKADNTKAVKVGFNKESYALEVNRQVAAATSYDGLYGLEIELEGVNLPTSASAGSGVTWVPHVDNSLRNGGMEYVTNGPITLNKVKPGCDFLFQRIADLNGEIQLSYRCSTHVHVNMAGVKVNTLASFVVLWGMFEAVLGEYAGADRAGNNFALPLSACDETVDWWVNAFKTGIFRYNIERRYLALNPGPLLTLGSLEIRSMRGVDNSDDVVAWVELIDTLFTAAKRYNNPRSIAEDVSGSGYEQFMIDVFGSQMSKFEGLPIDITASVREGFRRMQPIIWALSWTDVLAEIDKPYVPDPFSAGSKNKKTGVVEEEERIRRILERAGRTTMTTGQTIRMTADTIWPDIPEPSGQPWLRNPVQDPRDNVN